MERKTRRRNRRKVAMTMVLVESEKSLKSV